MILNGNQIKSIFKKLTKQDKFHISNDIYRHA